VACTRLALCGWRHRSLLPARCRLVDEGCDDSAARHRYPSRGNGDLVTGQAPMRCCIIPTQPVHRRAVAEPHGRSGVVCSMSRSGNVWDNAAMESFFSSLKTSAQDAKRTARATKSGYIERLYNAKRRHSTLGSQSDGVRNECSISLSWCQPNRSSPGSAVVGSERERNYGARIGTMLRLTSVEREAQA
jgi:putative transposase